MKNTSVMQAIEAHNDVACKIIAEYECKAKEDIKNFLLAVVNKVPEDIKVSFTVEGLLGVDKINISELRVIEVGESIKLERKLDSFWLEKFMVDELGARSAGTHVTWFFN